MTLHVGHGIGGTPQGIGPIGDLAPPARPMHGRVVGLIPMLKFAGDVVGPLAQARTNARKKAREARAKQAGRENRAAYTRWMGTSRRPPRQPWGGEPEAETPFSEEYEPKHMKKPPRKTMDTSNMRDWTP